MPSKAPQPTERHSPLVRLEERIWKPDPGAYGGRKRKRGGRYHVFIPRQIAGRRFALDEDAVAAVSDASGALAHLESTSPRLASLNALAANLLRSESAASSRIEGLAISHKRLARAAYKGTGGDNRAAEVLGNVEAMQKAIELGTSAKRFTVADIQTIHRTLLRFTADRSIAGVIRTKQNWIGGNDYNPLGATYVPPPPKYVPRLLEDLCEFVQRDDLATVAQAAIAHAQFENIHPFADGNGRVGRALIYTILRRRGEATKYIPPVSLVLATEPKNYIGGLGAFSNGDVSAWCAIFARVTGRATQEAEHVAELIEQLQASWLQRLGNPRSDAAVRQLVSALPAQPVIDVAAGQELTGKSHVAIQSALQQLESARVLHRLNERKWGRVWECDELLDLVEEFEGTVASR